MKGNLYNFLTMNEIFDVTHCLSYAFVTQFCKHYVEDARPAAAAV